MKRFLSILLAVLMLAVMLPVTAMAVEAPTWKSRVDFDAATVVYYTYTHGGTVVKEGDAAQHTPVVAYKVDSGSDIAYAADLRAAMMNGASEVFCKENATVSTVGAHTNVTKSITIYANNANFGGGDLSIYADGSANYPAPTEMNVTISIYNAKNLVVWGEPQNVGRVWNVNFYDCVNEGSNFFMYRGGSDKTDKANLTMINCKATGYTDSTVHTTADGSIVIKNCEFNNNCAPINIAHKQAGTITITIENSTFNSCGSTNTANGLNQYAAPARFVNNSETGKLYVTLKDNTFTDTVGENGDILLGDQRNGKSTFDVNAEIVTKQDVTVKSGNSEKQNTFVVKANTSVKANAWGEQPEVIRDNTPIIIYPPTDDTPNTTTGNPTTGANDFVGIAAAAAVVALLGSAVILRKK